MGRGLRFPSNLLPPSFHSLGTLLSRWALQALLDADDNFLLRCFWRKMTTLQEGNMLSPLVELTCFTACSS